MLPIQPCENGGGISWITAWRLLPSRSGASVITSRSDGAIATHSLAGAAATISPGLSADGLTLPEAMAAEAWAGGCGCKQCGSGGASARLAASVVGSILIAALCRERQQTKRPLTACAVRGLRGSASAGNAEPHGASLFVPDSLTASSDGAPLSRLGPPCAPRRTPLSAGLCQQACGAVAEWSGRSAAQAAPQVPTCTPCVHTATPLEARA